MRKFVIFRLNNCNKTEIELFVNKFTRIHLFMDTCECVLCTHAQAHWQPFALPNHLKEKNQQIL